MSEKAHIFKVGKYNFIKKFKSQIFAKLFCKNAIRQIDKKVFNFTISEKFGSFIYLPESEFLPRPTTGYFSTKKKNEKLNFKLKVNVQSLYNAFVETESATVDVSVCSISSNGHINNIKIPICNFLSLLDGELKNILQLRLKEKTATYNLRAYREANGRHVKHASTWINIKREAEFFGRKLIFKMSLVEIKNTFEVKGSD